MPAYKAYVFKALSIFYFLLKVELNSLEREQTQNSCFQFENRITWADLKDTPWSPRFSPGFSFGSSKSFSETPN